MAFLSQNHLSMETGIVYEVFPQASPGWLLSGQNELSPFLSLYSV